jgi:hypothetical protein
VEATDANFCKVVINHGADNPPSIGEYILGPLPTPLSSITLESANPVLERSKKIYHRADIPYTARMYPSNPSLHSEFIAKLLSPIEDAIEDLLGGKVIPEKPGVEADLLVGLTTPLSYDGSWRRSWLQFRKNGPGSFLRPLDMYCESRVDLGGKPSLTRSFCSLRGPDFFKCFGLACELLKRSFAVLKLKISSLLGWCTTNKYSKRLRIL